MSSPKDIYVAVKGVGTPPPKKKSFGDKVKYIFETFA